MSAPDARHVAVGRLVGQLARWAEAAGESSPAGGAARAALAHLRHGLGKRRGDHADADRHVVPLLRAEASDWEADVFCLVATLFAAHPVGRERGGSPTERSFGQAFREMEDRGERPNEPVAATERRFVALLNASPERLAAQLRHAIRLLATRRTEEHRLGVPVDWFQLTWDLLDWEDQDSRRRVKARWSRAYWGYQPPRQPAQE